MDALYTWVKYLHVLIAIVGMGTSAGLGVALELYAGDVEHGGYLLHVIERLLRAVVIPAYAILLATGVWMARHAWTLRPDWIRGALALWGIGLPLLAASTWAVHRLARRVGPQSHGPAGTAGRGISWLARMSGAAFGAVVVLMVYLMIFKPR